MTDNSTLSSQASQPPFLASLLIALFFFSGVAALTYEVLWLRWLAILLGSSSISLTITLMAFMSGLAIGAWKLGQLADRLEFARLPLMFVVLEASVGLYALLMPGLLEGVDTIYVALFRFFQPDLGLASVLRGSLAFVLLILPTILMGGSLPVMVRILNRMRAHQGLAVNVSRLYAWNTAGAIVGTLLTGYVLLAQLGILLTNTLAAFINFGIAALFYYYFLHRPDATGLTDRNEQRANDHRSQGDGVVVDAPLRRFLLVTYALSGVSAFIYEVAWTRTLEMILGTTTYAFTVMLATFLLGIALGSFIYRRIPRSRCGLPLYAMLQLGIVVFAILSSVWLEQLPLLYLQMHVDNWFLTQLIRFVLASAIMIVPTTAMGVLFPLISALTVSSRAASHGVGTAYGVNTLGAAVGAGVAGLILIPAFGMQYSILSAAALNLGVVLAVLLRQPASILVRGLSSISAMLLCAVVSLSIHPWDPRIISSGVYIYAENYFQTADRYNRLVQTTGNGEVLPERLLWQAAMQQFEVKFFDTGITSTVAVMDDNKGTRSLLINGKVDASASRGGGQSDLLTQEVMAHLPLLFAPHRRQVFVVGLGSGITAGSALYHDVSKLDVAELSPAVIEASALFDDFNNNLQQSDRTTIFAADARQHLRIAEPETYDVIISQPSNPWIRGESMLFSYDWYELVKSRLASEGYFSQWIPAYNISPRNLKTIVQTMRAVFPNVTVWQSGNPGDLVLIACKDDSRLIDYGAVRARVDNSVIGERMEALGLDPESFFFDLFVMGPREIEKYLQRGLRHPLLLNTDDRLITEYSTPHDMLKRNNTAFFVELAPEDFNTQSLLRVTTGLQAEDVRKYRKDLDHYGG